jgi:hypothetical protein
MILGSGHSLRAFTLVPHASASLSRALSSQTSRPTSVHQVMPSGLVMVAGYLLVLVFLVVFGVCMGWQRPGGGGNGGGGPHMPRVQEPTPPGGQQLAGDSPQPAHADDFTAWEAQLHGADKQAVAASPEDARVEKTW